MTPSPPRDAVAPRSATAVRVVLHADGTALLQLDGALEKVQADPQRSATRAVVALLRQRSSELGTALRVAATYPDGTGRRFTVHPDGRLTDDAVPAPPEHRPAPVASPPARSRPAPAAPDGAAASAASPHPLPSRRALREARARRSPGATSDERGPGRSGGDDAPAAAAPPTRRAAARRAASTAAAGRPEQPAERAQRPSPPPSRRADLRRRRSAPPTVTDLLDSRPDLTPALAETGWQGAVRRATGGLVTPRPSEREQTRRSSSAAVTRTLDGPKTVVVVNPKGGAHKTTATLLLAATYGSQRGSSILAWDNNETRGTLGWRAAQAKHRRTAVDLLRDLDHFTTSPATRVGDLDNYVRSQGSARFDVLASDEDAASAASIDAAAFRRLHSTLSRFYRLIVVDTGNNMRASNWQAAVASADQLVIISTIRDDTSASAAWLADALRATGRGELVSRAVTVLSAPARKPDRQLTERLHDHFGRLTRAVVEVPHDPSLVTGGPIDYQALRPQTLEAWLHVSAAVTDGL